MEITMTLTVSPEKAIEIAQLLQNPPALTAPTAMQQPSAAQIPTQPNPMQQPGIPAQQMIPAAVPQSTPVQGNPYPAAVPQQTVPPMQQSGIPMQQPTPAAIPQSAPTYSIQDLTLAARPLMEMGKQAELAQLLAEFGVQAVAQLPENRRADFAARLRAMGGQI